MNFNLNKNSEIETSRKKKSPGTYVYNDGVINPLLPEKSLEWTLLFFQIIQIFGIVLNQPICMVLFIYRK